MNKPIDLDHNRIFSAEKIKSILFIRVLTPEFDSIQLAIPKRFPQNGLSPSWLLTERLSVLNGSKKERINNSHTPPYE